ncbi:MAG: hypothetical protein ABFD82_16220 [Syntrophaceae bacterium]
MEDQYVLIIWAVLFIFLGFSNKLFDTYKNIPRPLKIVTPLLFPVIPVFLLWILHHNVLNNWWMLDDPCHLFYLSQNGIYPAFFDNTRSFSPINFTPLFPLSLGIDFGLFGFHPAPFYWHHLISLSIVLLVAYVFLVRFMSPLITVVALSLFVASVPVCDSANLLMTRHYIEGLSFTLISFHLFLKALDRNDINYSWGSTFFYFLACLAKEVYVPLVFLIVAITAFFPYTPKSRGKLLYPFFLAAAVYTLWRFNMLSASGMLTAYSHIPLTYKNILYLPLSIIKTMEWNSFGQLIVIGVLFIAFLMYAVKNTWKENVVILLCILGVVLPIIPVSNVLSSRYLFVFSFLFFIGMGLGLQYISEISLLKTYRNEILIFFGLASIIICVFHSEKSTMNWREYGKQIRTEGEFLLYNDDPQNLLVTSHGHCYWAFSALRKNMLGLPQGASFCARDCICPYLHPDKKVWIDIRGQLFEDKNAREQKSPEDCGAKRELKIDCSYTKGTLKWMFGPYVQGGRYLLFLRGWDSGLIQVKREGAIEEKFDLNADFIIVKYESYEGWSTYSPVLRFNKAGANNEGFLNWHR